jgi:hypothetical protein
VRAWKASSSRDLSGRLTWSQQDKNTYPGQICKHQHNLHGKVIAFEGKRPQDTFQQWQPPPCFKNLVSEPLKMLESFIGRKRVFYFILHFISLKKISTYFTL